MLLRNRVIVPVLVSHANFGVSRCEKREVFGTGRKVSFSKLETSSSDNFQRKGTVSHSKG